MAPSLNAADEFGKSTEHRQEKSLLSLSVGKEAAGIPHVCKTSVVTRKVTLDGAERTRQCQIGLQSIFSVEKMRMKGKGGRGEETIKGLLEAKAPQAIFSTPPAKKFR